jgi:hydrogenase maturation protease
VNTFPVLASDGDDAVLGAAIVLPDHPQIAPESRGAMFDSTEIEEALLLHVKTLSDDELEQIERDDPHVREMVERVAAATPEDVLALHGRVTLRDPAPTESTVAPGRFTARPPQEPAGLFDPRAGETEVDVDGVRFRRGAKVRLCPGEDADLHARMLGGRVATIERILIDYDGKAHLGVTVDGDPGQDLLHDDGFGGEVARRLQQHQMAPGVAVMDAGTGGLDLAYEVMRGYDALLILDVSRRQGQPGTLYVMEVSEESVDAGIEDGEVIDPHGMDPRTMLRFVRSVGAWPGRVLVIACEPDDVEELGFGLSREVEAAVERAVALVVETVEELRLADAGATTATGLAE